MKRNTYRTLGKLTKLSTKAVVSRPNGEKEEVYVKFTGGGFKPDRKPGEFITQDQDLIKALDKKGDNGKLFELASSVDVKTNEKFVESTVTAEEVVKAKGHDLPEEEPPVDEPAEEGDVEDEPVEATEEGPSELDLITTVVAAKNFLIEKFEVSANSVKNKELVLAVAKEKGLEFPNLK